MLSIPPDHTFLIQLASFFVLMWVLNRLLFAPFSALLAEREQKTEGDSREAARQSAEAHSLGQSIEKELSAARTEAAGQAEAIRQETRRQEAEIFADAQAQASQRLAEIRAGVEAEKDKALAGLRAEAEGLAAEMVAAVVSGEARAS